VEFLEATKNFCVDGRQLRVWVSPVPPVPEPTICALPKNSGRPNWKKQELDYFTIGPYGIFNSCSKDVDGQLVRLSQNSRLFMCNGAKRLRCFQ
jgi:hypothetical protein